MKTIITISLLAISALCYSQGRLDITIIGTTHYFDDDHKSLQDFQAVQDFIISLNPDMICIEAIPVNDTLSLSEIWPNTMKRADRLRDSLKYHNAFPVDSALSVSSIKKGDPFWGKYRNKRALLEGANHYASYDLWNAYYQWFQIQQAGDSLYYFSKFQRKLNNSEYGLMVFPAAQKLGVKKLHGIDYRYGEDSFLQNNKKVLKKLFFSLKWKPLKVYLKTQKKYRKANKEGKLMEFINGPEFQNSFSELIDELPKKLPKSTEAKAIKTYWLKRNQIMADRLIQEANAQSANTILLTVGGAHVTHIKRFLEAQGHTVTTYGQIINRLNK
ncbi:MAG: DUF5694 domain-containing protein [Ekhidna sp.]